MPTFLDRVHSVFSSLNGEKVRYLLVGGMAVAAHGHVRATNDIDLVVALDQPNALAAIRAFAKLGYRPTVPVNADDFADKHCREKWGQEKGMLVFQMRTGDPLDVPVDIFVSEPFDFDQAYEKALWAELMPQLEVPVVPLNLLLSMKEQAGRSQDRDDIRILRELHPE